MAKTCCFSGHRRLPNDQLEAILRRLHVEIDALICEGVTDFISGGALGFDLLAAALIVAKKDLGADIRLIFMLPCRDQDALWTESDKRSYRDLLDRADEICYTAEAYRPGCMRMRNLAMIERADICICALWRQASGTGQAVGYARNKGCRIINVAE